MAFRAFIRLGLGVLLAWEDLARIKVDHLVKAHHLLEILIVGIPQHNPEIDVFIDGCGMLTFLESLPFFTVDVALMQGMQIA